MLTSEDWENRWGHEREEAEADRKVVKEPREEPEEVPHKVLCLKSGKNERDKSIYLSLQQYNRVSANTVSMS